MTTVCGVAGVSVPRPQVTPVSRQHWPLVTGTLAVTCLVRAGRGGVGRGAGWRNAGELKVTATHFTLGSCSPCWGQSPGHLLTDNLEIETADIESRVSVWTHLCLNWTQHHKMNIQCGDLKSITSIIAWIQLRLVSVSKSLHWMFLFGTPIKPITNIYLICLAENLGRKKSIYMVESITQHTTHAQTMAQDQTPG